MAQTIPDMEVTSSWQSVNVEAGVTVGTAMLMVNKSNSQIVVAEGTEPTPDSLDGWPLEERGKFNSSLIIDADSLEIWVRISEGKGTGLINVQEDA